MLACLDDTTDVDPKPFAHGLDNTRMNLHANERPVDATIIVAPIVVQDSAQAALEILIDPDRLSTPKGRNALPGQLYVAQRLVQEIAMPFFERRRATEKN